MIGWELVNGPVPQGKILHHTCENKGCVNPSHLVLTTRAEHQRHHHRQDTCRSGRHSMTDVANVYIGKNGRWACRACAAERARDRRRRLALAESEA